MPSKRRPPGSAGNSAKRFAGSSARNFGGSLAISIFLHGLALLAADLFGGPVFPGKEDAVPGPARLAVTIQKPAVAVIRGSRLREPAKPQEKPAAPAPNGEIKPARDPGASNGIEDKGIEDGLDNSLTGVTVEVVAEEVTQAVAETITEVVTEGVAGTVTEAATEAGTGAGKNTAAAGNGKTAQPHGTAEITRPVAVNRNPPVYPRTARENNWEGSVLLDAVILPDGTVGDLRVERSSGYGLLDTAALAAVKDWRYRPALKDNTPVACRIKINIQFILEE